MDPTSPPVPNINPEFVNTPQESIPVSPTPKNNHLTIISLAVFIVLALGTVAFFYYQNQQLKQMLSNLNLPSPTPVDLTDPLASWKLYNNSPNNYQFKIPKDWIELESDSSLPNKVAFQSTDGLYRFTLNFEENKNKTTGKPYKTLDDVIGLPYTVKTITIDNREARQPLPKAGMENFYKAYLFSPDEKFIYSLELLVGDGTLTDHRVSVESLRIGGTIFDQIVSTFKFTVEPPVTPQATASGQLSATPSTRVCTMEAKVCPDGSSVGRTGPNCEFSPCPTPTQ